MMKKKIFSLLLVVLLCVGLLCACEPVDRNVYTEEEHIERITELLQKFYFNADGTVTEYGRYTCYRNDNAVDGYIAEVQGFEVEILKSHEGKPEYFLIKLAPSVIGVIPGIIIDNQYRYFGLNRYFGGNPFEENGIEEGNRYYTFYGSSKRGFAAMIDGVLTDLLHEGYVYTAEAIQTRADFLRSPDGLRFTKNYSGLLK